MARGNWIVPLCGDILSGPLGPDISENRPLGNVSCTPLVPDGRGADTLLVTAMPLLLGRERIVQGECSAVHIPRDT